MKSDPRSTARPRTEAKRDRIAEVAMRHFAENGYQGARVEDIAIELGIAKGSVFQHFGSKAGLFLAAYKKAVTALPSWQDAPAPVKEEGFFESLKPLDGEGPHSSDLMQGGQG